MKHQNISLFCIATLLALNVANVCHSQIVTAASFMNSQGDESSLVGTWRFSGGDAGAQQMILLELRADGTYTKTLAAYWQGMRYGGTHSGTWTANGSVVHLSGDAKWPAVAHDLARFVKVS